MPTASRTNEQRLEKLLSLLSTGRTVLIVMQNCPDPDALGAAAGLRALANARANSQCTLAYGGAMGRMENRALASYLGISFRSFADLDVERYDLTALVDTQPGTGNNPFPTTRIPDIVIDHHPIRRATRAAAYTDVRSRYGATSTILFEYLQTAGIEPEPPLATGLLYGIRSDTQDLGREATQADIKAFLALYPLANQRMLARIQHADIPQIHFRILSNALHRAKMAGSGVCADLGEVDTPDIIAEVADLLLRCEGCDSVLCYGTRENDLLLSLRLRNDSRNNAGKYMRAIVGRYGTGGGHKAMAGGQIPLAGRPSGQRSRILAAIERRFFRRLEVDGIPPRPFLG
jgi:nanoRNase/pAp phosphatase (c-di-AMP/oligoRNAs hydrolase)